MPAGGDVLAGKYRGLQKLGEGGMGVVFRAENVDTGKLWPSSGCTRTSRPTRARVCCAKRKPHHACATPTY